MTSRPPYSDPASFPDEFLRAVLDLSLSGMICYLPVTDASGQLIDLAFAYLNPAAQRALHLPARPSRTYGQQFPEGISSGEFAFLRDVFRTEQTQEITSLHRPAAYDVAVRVAARRLGAGLLVSFAPITAEPDYAPAPADVTPVAPEPWPPKPLYHLLEQAPALICLFTGPQHIFQFVNPPFQALVGERPLLGRPVAAAVPELAGQPIFGLLDEVYRTGETFRATEMLVQLDHHNDGRHELEKRYYNFIYQARRNSLGIPDGIFVFAYDVTDQVQARQRLALLNASLEARVAERTRAAERTQHEAELQRAQLDLIFMQAPAAICVLDGPQMVYQLVNPGYQQAFPGRPLLGRPLLEALPELRDSTIPAILADVYATGESFQALELPLRAARTDGGPLEQMYWTFTYQPRRDAAGLVDGVLVFAYDVTAQVEARQQMEEHQRRTQTLVEELAATNAQLTRANTDLDNFIYTASHDLKAPITNIEGLLQVLRQELTQQPPAPHTEQVLHLMQDSVQRFQRTIKYLTDITQWRYAQEQPAEPVPLAPLVESICLDLAPLLAVSGGQVELAPGSCDTVFFAEKHLRSLVYNLLSNALKYRAPDRAPRVQVRCHTDASGAAVLEVQDNGLGLTPAQLKRVFGMFQRLHSHVEGSGIGLYLVKQLVEQAGGRIEVESQLGEGSTFRAVLPR